MMLSPPHIVCLSALLAMAACATLPAAEAAPKAFPGAKGFGATAVGGRGGAVYAVTNLNDSGTGSLRACVQASGARTCVFRVGGTIVLSSVLEVRNPRLTIAGQTAPGGGVQLRLSPNHTKPLLRIQTSDVVIRHLRLRRGETALTAAASGTCCGDTVAALGGTDRLVLDHVSVGFATDENIDLYQARNVTIQNSIVAYGLRYSTDSDTVANPSQHHSMGVIIGDGATNLSLLDNLLAFNLNRNPRIQSGLNEVCGNVVYGAQANPITISGGQVNVVGNRFDPRPFNGYRYVVAHQRFRKCLCVHEQRTGGDLCVERQEGHRTLCNTFLRRRGAGWSRRGRRCPARQPRQLDRRACAQRHGCAHRRSGGGRRLAGAGGWRALSRPGRRRHERRLGAGGRPQSRQPRRSQCRS